MLWGRASSFSSSLTLLNVSLWMRMIFLAFQIMASTPPIFLSIHPFSLFSRGGGGTTSLPFMVAVSAHTSAELLTGSHFRITALHEDGFLDVIDNDDGEVTFSGYLIEMIAAIAHQANFTYTLATPSGLGSKCVPQYQLSEEEWLVSMNTADPPAMSSAQSGPYSSLYRTQYNCGTSDVTDVALQNTSYGSDMYLGMYYITPSRLLENQFTIPFVPPFSGTLAMFGTAVGIPNFDALVEQQQLGLIDPSQTCGPAGTALIDSVQESFPGLQIRGIYGGEQDIYQAFYNQECSVYIIDAPIAAQFVLRRSRQGQCTDQTGMVRGG
jgi:hypothetical protein